MKTFICVIALALCAVALSGCAAKRKPSAAIPNVFPMNRVPVFPERDPHAGDIRFEIWQI